MPYSGASSGGGSGTVTAVTGVTANGFVVTTANSTTTPAITVGTGITGLLLGNGTLVSAAATTGTGNVVLAGGTPVVTGTVSFTGTVAAGVSPVLIASTTWTVSGGTGTNTFPQLYINGGAAPTTLSTAGTGICVNLPSGSTANIFDGRVNGGSSNFVVSSTGALTTTSTIVIGGAIQCTSIIATGAIATPAWTTSGRVIRAMTNTYTDSTSSGTVAVTTINTFQTPTLAATSVVTYTNSSTVYIASAPTSGTNVTQTNAWALHVAAGACLFVGGITVGTGTLISASSALTNGAAAQLATMSNGPSAGNPTKWIPINDAGTTRYIPAW